MEYSNLFVCLMGIGTVFIGLICIIVLVSIMSSIVRGTDKAMAKRTGPQGEAEDGKALAAPAVSAGTPAGGEGNRVQAAEVTPELIAAISACIAEDLGTDVSAIRIRSLKKA